jgi:DNA polymerase-1
VIKSASLKKKLEEGRDMAYTSQMLATINLDVPINFDFEHCRLTMPDLGRLKNYFDQLNFRQLTTRLPRVLAQFSGADESSERSESSTSPTSQPRVAAAVAAASAAEATQATSSPAAVGTVTAPESADSAESAPAPAQTYGGQLSLFSLTQPAASSTEQRAALPRELRSLAGGLAPTGPLPGSIPSINIAPAPQASVITSNEALQELIAAIKDQTVLTIDLETTGLDSLDTKIVGWALSFDPLISMEAGRVVVKKGVENSDSALPTFYIPVRHAEANQLDPDYVVSQLKPLLEDPAIGKVAQNAKFEMNVLSTVGIKLAPLCFDTMLASYILNPDSKHGLKDQSDRVLNYQMVRIEELIGSGRKQITIDQAPLDKVALYACDDARITLELARYYSTLLDEEQKFLLYEMEQPLCAVLAKMEQTGVALDVDYLSKFSDELAGELARLETEIYQLAGHGFNINSTQQLQKVLFEELGLKPKGKTKTGFSTDASVLEGLREEHEIIGKLLDYRHISKLRSTYVEALPKQILARDGRLHGEFNQTVTSTGRLSSSNPNLQNIPIRTDLGRRIRRAFIAGDENSSLISADYSQIELRLLAHMCADETLIDAFEKDQDIHARTAGEIYEVPIEQVSSDMRRVGKTINFALVYQQGAYSTGLDLGISTKEAQGFIDKYFARYPKVQGFLQSTIADAREKSYAHTIWGRRRYFRHLHDRNDNIRKADERAACNAPIQGSAADLIKLAMVKLDQELVASGSKARLTMQVHDELVMEVPNDEIEATRKVIDQAMTKVVELKVPLKVDMGVGKNWMDAK